MNQTPQEQPQRKKILADEFIKIWRGDYKGIKGYEKFYNNNTVVFDNYNITPIYCYGEEYLPTIVLINCYCEDIFLAESKLMAFKLINNTSIVTINISTCRISSFELLNSHILEGLDISDNSTVKRVVLRKSTIQLAKIYKSICPLVIVREKSELKYLELEATEVEEILVIVHSKLQTAAITNKSKIKFFKLNRGSEINSLVLYSSSISSIQLNNAICNGIRVFQSEINNINISEIELKSIDIEEGTNLKSLNISKCIIDDLKISYANVSNTIICDSSSLSSIQLIYLGEKSKKFIVEGSRVGDLVLNIHHPYQLNIKEAVNEDNGKTTITRSTIGELIMDSTILPSSSYLHISQTFINEIYINSFINEGRIVFNDIRPDHDATDIEASVSILDSDLGNTQFIACDLDMYDEFEFENSKILDVFLADTVLPEYKFINKSMTDKNEQVKLALAQFKKIYENQGDTVRALEMRAQEMEVYRQLLRENKEIKNRNTERFNLYLNKYSNNYGTDWLRAVIVTLSITLCFYIAYCSSRSIYPANPFNKENIWMFITVSPYYFEFLNPVHKTDFFIHIKDGEPNPLALLIDYFSRIVVAYLVYQTIQAFRKFGKK